MKKALIVGCSHALGIEMELEPEGRRFEPVRAGQSSLLPLPLLTDTIKHHWALDKWK